MPHLELEMGLTAGKEQLLMCIIMDPRLSLVMNPRYLEQYYTTAPPGQDKSWMQLDASAQASPGFTRFTSPSLHVRAFASSAILYNAAAGLLKQAFGDQVMEDYWDSMAGGARVRTLEDSG
eukprot:gene13391-13518_t